MPLALSEICLEETGQDLNATIQETKLRDQICLVRDKAVIDPEIFYGFFEIVAKKIVQHVKNILDSRYGSNVALLLMVGGFSESKYIQNIMKSEFQSDTMDVLIPKDPGMSVIKGTIVIAREEKLLDFRGRDDRSIAITRVHEPSGMVRKEIQGTTTQIYDSENQSEASTTSAQKSHRKGEPYCRRTATEKSGGTADIVIHKKIDQRRVKELSRPSGGPWSGTAVDWNFQQFLIKIVGARVFKKFSRECPLDYAELMQEFDVKKRNVDQGMKKKVYMKVID
ncbi:hypothetical protein CHS0354_032397 [Potamilus streckersoni]|uniref:Uncharacterized protein n=1 Tax=Potamilus streckersoni TaxID=2493646 RepID=A0AAE0TGN8_9BIVA|nr:hypothetical protein CHS0354_032397 [Potamilus streckersoni]